MPIQDIADLAPDIWLDARFLRGVLAPDQGISSGAWDSQGAATVPNLDLATSGTPVPPTYRREAVAVNGHVLDAVEFFRQTGVGASWLRYVNLTLAQYTMIALLIPKSSIVGGIWGSASNFAALSMGFGWRRSGGVHQLNARLDNFQLSWADTPVVGTPITAALRNGVSSRQIIKNGVVRASDTRSSGSMNPNGGWTIGHGSYLIGDDADTQSLDAYLIGIAVFYRTLSDAEVLDVHNWMIAGMQPYSPPGPEPFTGAEVAIDGVDLATHGVKLDRNVGGWADGQQAEAPQANIPGSIAGAIALTNVPTIFPRMLRLSGWIAGDTRAELQTNLDGMRHLLDVRSLHFVQFGDTPDRFYTGRVRRFEVLPLGAWLADTRRRFVLDIECLDPRATDSAEQVIELTAVAAEAPVGTAAVGPVIRIEGPATAADIVYRDSVGTAITTMQLAGLDLAAGEWIDIDCERMTIVDDAGEDRSDVLAAGDFIVIDPRDAGALEAGSYPTLEVTGAPGAASATYQRRW